MEAGSSLALFRAPGRVNLIGEHTDYAGGLVLPVAIDRALVVSGARAEEVLRLSSDRFPGTVALRLDERGDVEGWGRYVAGVASQLAELGRPPVGFSGHVSGNLPAGAGLGSSAALEVAVATALCAVAGFALPALELAEACRRAEERAVGVPCGIMDQAASLLGRAGHALLLDCATLDYRYVPLPEAISLLVVESGIERRLSEAPYAQRGLELEAGHPRRVRHVESENERVRELVDALERDDRGMLALLFAASRASLRDDFEVSTPRLDLLVERALAAGAFAARLTGAGFGGSVLALADADQASDVAARLADVYAVHRCSSADGARDL